MSTKTPLAENVRRWDEEDGNLYTLTATLGGSTRTVRFGVRDFRAEGGVLTLNGRRIFLRSEANCAVFPEEGHPPMTVERWREVLAVYRSYGVNCMRFHSHIPPEAAFAAADEMGMLMQPELSHWNPETAFESPESLAYYTGELRQALRFLANHPSFVMLTLGNELASGELGHRRMEDLLSMAHAMDATRLFACGSNTHYGWYGYQGGSDFYTSFHLREQDLRATYDNMKGYLNTGSSLTLSPRTMRNATGSTLPLAPVPPPKALSPPTACFLVEYSVPPLAMPKDRRDTGMRVTSPA